MKNRLLPFGLPVLFFGFFFFLFSQAYATAVPDNNTPDQTSDVRMQQIRSNQVTGVVDPADVLAARHQLSLLKGKGPASLGLNWMHVGPTNYAGRSRVVLFDNQDTEGMTIYTGGVTGGVYKSTNKGLTWHAINTSSSEILRVSAMTQTPGGTIYLGTGEYYCQAGDFMGTGLFRSTNGMDFTLVEGTQPDLNDPLSDWAYVLKLACDANSGRLYAATNTGLKYSNDGDNWSGALAGMAIDVAVGSNGTVLFVLDNFVYIAPGGDLGNITNLSTGDPGMLPVTDAGWTSVAIAPSNPAVMYASIAKQSDANLLGVYRSEDHGATWSLIFPPNPTYEPFAGEGCYSNSIEVFPANENMVLLGGPAAWLGKKYQPTGYFDWQQVSFGAFAPNGPFAPSFHHDYMFRPGYPTEFAIATSNGIATGTYSEDDFVFQTSNKNLATSQFNSVTFGPLSNWMMGGGIRVGTELFNVIQMNTPTEGYVPPTSFRTGTYSVWSQLQPSSIIFSGTNFYPDPPYVRSEDFGVTPALSFIGDITSSLTQYLPSVLWETMDFPYSQDTIWIYARQGPIEADSTIIVESLNCNVCSFYFTVPVTIPEGDSLGVLDPVHSRFFLYGSLLGHNGVLMTQDAIKFSKVPAFYLVSDMGVNIPTCMSLSSDLNYLWMGTETGKLYRVSNLTLALDSVRASVESEYCIVATSVFEYPEMAGRYITNVVVDPTDDNHLMITLGNYGNNTYVYVTENALDSLPVFYSAQGNLPQMPVFDGVLELHGVGRAILATDMGVFSTSNIHATSPEWAPDYTGMGDLPVTDLKQQLVVHPFIENAGFIAAASFGRGLFYDTTYHITVGIDPGPGSNAANTTLKLHPNPVQQTLSVTYTLSEPGPVIAYVYDLTGRLMKSTSFGTQPGGSHTSTLNLGTLPAGTYVVRINHAYGKVVKTN